jgi:hypothetical protein
MKIATDFVLQVGGFSVIVVPLNNAAQQPQERNDLSWSI